ncbi:hypothetical protein DL762_004192 [Monosporascus cannonballus]|uniref:Uncharacterized protein n=1 Tax=Monosporascus cannonballus TaxID=155416 RepID=A0ABY0H9H9_9PEZI|nr:hypothetical protein DL763_008197 [Monosporascus cannonballus]RYO87546.1 hypothetical protein DL762_004192 [Monosporascus cannonballus]
MIRMISGCTLASRIIRPFQAGLATAQETHKLSLMFGSFEPLLAFFALSALTDDESLRGEVLWVRLSLPQRHRGRHPTVLVPAFRRPHAETALPWNEFNRSTDRSPSATSRPGASYESPGIIGAVTSLGAFGLLATSACVFGDVRITWRNRGLGRFEGQEDGARSRSLSRDEWH